MNLLDLPIEILLQIFQHAAGKDKPAGQATTRSVASLLGFTGKRENVLTTLALVSRKCQDIAYEFFYGSLSMTNDRAERFYRSLEKNPRLGSLVVSYRFISCDLAHLRAFHRSIYSLPPAQSALRVIHSPMVATLSSLVDREQPPLSPSSPSSSSIAPSRRLAVPDSVPIRTLTLSSVHPIRDVPKLVDPRSAWMNTSELEKLVLNFTPINLAPTLPLRSTDPFYSVPLNPVFARSLRSLTLGNPVQGLEPDVILPVLERLPNLVRLTILGSSAPSLNFILRAVPGLQTIVFTRAPQAIAERSFAQADRAKDENGNGSENNDEAVTHRALRQIEILSPNETRLIESFNRRFLDLIPSLRSFQPSTHPAPSQSARAEFERRDVRDRLHDLPALETVRLAGLVFDQVRASGEGLGRVTEFAVALDLWGIKLVDQDLDIW
ncbi:hypothetical protein [Phaffia rhodozyma]|uniref:F-box domain n=1 Tax=Phaffia rhodozyma TaxID=264483 RepID=A0A0F7SEW0_PHARH|nr:hypothetical protein [Phaffia rhodozyma]